MDRWDWGTARKAIPLAAETYAAIEVRAMSDDEREAFLADFSDAWSFKALNKVKKRAETYRPPTVAEQPEQPAS
jgi:hypothetical protein